MTVPSGWTRSARSSILPVWADPVEDATEDLVQAIAAGLIDRAGDGTSFDAEWDDPWAWAQAEIADASAGYGDLIADRVEAEALDAMIDAAQTVVDERSDGEAGW